MYKITHRQAPQYLQDVLPVANPAIANYDLRNADKLPSFRCRTAMFEKSFFPKTILDWNNLNPNIRNAESLESFKNKLSREKNTSQIPKWFYVGERRYSMIHARLRMLCSTLNDYLFSQIHVIDDPQCPCGHNRETTKHFLIDCPLYNVERNIMFRELQALNCDPTCKNLLYGSTLHDLKTNTNAFLSIQAFLKNSGRFNT